MHIERISPASYHRQPWKNGGGVSITIASELHRDGARGDWSDIIWQLGRTSIVTSAPFSDLSGFGRRQVVVRGSGLVLTTPTGEIDVRTPLVPVAFDGGTPIVSRLENGPVDVVNLIARHGSCDTDLYVLRAGTSQSLTAAQHIVYAPVEESTIAIEGSELTLAIDHSLRLSGKGVVTCNRGVVVVASIDRV